MTDRADDIPPRRGGANEDAYVPSPCQNVCVMNEETGYCLGCFRTIEEIMDWGAMSAEEKRRVLAELEARERG